MTTSYAAHRVITFVALLLAIAFFAMGANAGTIIGILLNPAATAGGGATSTRSGVGTFQIYAVDEANLGISSYDLTMGPLVTASNNRSPVTNITDGNGDTWQAGFSLLRTASNAPSMQGSQPLPGTTPYLIAGMGQTTGNFTTVATTMGVQPGATATPTTSPQWGGPYNNGLTDSGAGKKWVLIGEGAWNGTSAVTSATQFVSQAALTAFGDQQQFVSIATTTSILPINWPEPTSLSLLCFGMVGGFGVTRYRRV